MTGHRAQAIPAPPTDAGAVATCGWRRALRGWRRSWRTPMAVSATIPFHDGQQGPSHVRRDIGEVVVDGLRAGVHGDSHDPVSQPVALVRAAAEGTRSGVWVQDVEVRVGLGHRATPTRAADGGVVVNVALHAGTFGSASRQASAASAVGAGEG